MPILLGKLLQFHMKNTVPPPPHTCTRVHTHAHVYTHMHTCTHTQIYYHAVYSICSVMGNRTRVLMYAIMHILLAKVNCKKPEMTPRSW
jgi:hypothetical protein